MPDAAGSGGGGAGSGGDVQITVDGDSDGARLDRFLARRFPEISRQVIQKHIQRGEVTLDGRPAKPSTRLSPGQTVRLAAIGPPEEPALEPEPIPLQILYEDEDLLVVHKPPGMVVHPGAGVTKGTLVHALLHHLPGWKGVGGADRPGIVHRLDRGTSGLLVVAKSPRAHTSLVGQIQERRVSRLYVALAWGCPVDPSGTVEAPVGRDPRHRQRMAVVEKGGREAVTEFERLRAFDTLSLLRLCLRTGRTHQIRVHLASIGHPIFGDTTYGGGRSYTARLAPRDRPILLGWLKALGRPALHAYHLAFHHPVDGERMVFEAPVPKDMEQVLVGLETISQGTGGKR
jgi:23S rRNA pseudouridine1911/1915/1917 synthase